MSDNWFLIVYLLSLSFGSLMAYFSRGGKSWYVILSFVAIAISAFSLIDYLVIASHGLTEYGGITILIAAIIALSLQIVFYTHLAGEA